MAPFARAFDAVHFYMNDFAARAVAKSGIPSDRFHLGKLILQGLSDDPDFVLQIDGATEECETNSSVLNRTIRCAISMQKLGLTKGDVIVLMGSNHIHLCIPQYAALSLGIIVAPLDSTLGIKELEPFFTNMEPKLIFCDSNKKATMKQILENINLNAIIITFNGEDECDSFAKFIDKCSDESAIRDFQPADFDTETTVACLATTSGTTGFPKAAALSHKNIAIAFSNVWVNFDRFPTPTKLVIVVAPINWLAASFYFLFGPILKFGRVQSSKPFTGELFIQLVNKYKPTYAGFSPTFMAAMIKPSIRERCDFTCFEHIRLGGSSVANKFMEQVKEVTPKANIKSLYGMTEIGGFAIQDGTQCHGSAGRPLGCFDCRLVNPETLEDVEEPYVNAELWLRGPSVFMGYYKNQEETKKVFVDGWIRTGDIFYLNETGHLYFVDRLKLLLKYMSYQISPVEVELVIREHPCVSDVAVTGIEDQEFGDLVVACVVRKPGSNVTAQEIKDIVKENLSDAKQLRGGVIFMSELPLTSSTKINRQLLKKIVPDMTRE